MECNKGTVLIALWKLVSTIEHNIHGSPMSWKRDGGLVISTSPANDFTITAVSGLQNIFLLNLIIVSIGPPVIGSFGHFHKCLRGKHCSLPVGEEVRKNGMEIIDAVTYCI